VKITKHAYIGIGVIAALGVAMPGFGASGNKYAASETQFTCSDDLGNEDGTVTLVGPLKLWPPNHKMIDEPITAQRTDKPGTSVTLTLTPVVTDAAGGDGGAQHDPDFSATSSDGKTFVANSSTEDPDSATAAFAVRAERSGKGLGRTYTINWTADWGNGDSCSSSDSDQKPFVITVPHDMSGGAGWKQ
jgi:hypothetical protein